MAKKVPITKVLSCFFVIVFLMSSFSVAVIASDSSNSTVSNVTDNANSSVESVALSNNITDLTCRDDLIYINKTETVVNESANSDLPVLNDTDISTAKTVSSLGYCSYVWIEITDKYCKGYKVYVDGVYQFTEGEDSVPDGYCRFKVTPGYHTFKLTLNGKEVSKGWNCQCGTGYNWMSMNDMSPHWCEGGGNDNPTDEYEVKFRGTVTSTTPSEYDCGFKDVYICEVKIEKVVSGDYFEKGDIVNIVYSQWRENAHVCGTYDKVSVGDTVEVYGEMIPILCVGPWITICGKNSYYLKKISSESLSINVWTDKREYKIGETVKIYYQANKKCTAKLTITKPDGGKVVYGPNEIPACTRSKSATAGYPIGKRTVVFEAWAGSEYKKATCYFDVVEEKKPKQPSPEIIKVEYPTACVKEEEYATISVTVANNGGASSEGYISVSFPNDEDVYVVSGTGNEYNKVYLKGSEIWGKDGKIPSSKDPLVELFDTNWGKYQQETITMKAKPNSGSDKIEFLVRAALKNDADGTYERDPTYSSYKDQQGWYVKKYSVDVCEYEKVKFRGKILVDNQIISFYSFDIKIDEVIDDPTGNLQKGETVNVYGHRDGPAHVDDVTVGDEVEVYGEYRGYVGTYEQIFLSDYGESSSDHYVKKIEEKPAPEIIKVEYPTKCVKEGDDATISVTVGNKGGKSSEGYISVSFPNDEDVSVVSGTGNGYNKLYPKGSEIWGKDGKISSSKDPLVDLLDTNWVKYQQETITMNVKPNSGSDEIVFYVRAALKNEADGSYERDPTYSGYTDQQGWYAERHVVEVCPKEAGVIIDDDTCVGYNVYVDDVYQLAEGVGETLDGYCTFYVTEGTHTIEIRDNGCTASITRIFKGTYTWDSMPDNWCKGDAKVEFKGTIVKDSSTSSFFNYKIKINDVLTDPSDVLNPGDEIWVWAVSGGSSQVDSVGIDDKVEVYGTYDGESHREVKLEMAEHYLELSTPPQKLFCSKGIYVWGFSENILYYTDEQERFFELCDKEGIKTVFLYINKDLLAGNPSSYADFIKNASDIQVHAMFDMWDWAKDESNAEPFIKAVLEYNSKKPSYMFDGIHLDVEPGQGHFSSMKEFLNGYKNLLSGIKTKFSYSGGTIKSQGMALSIDVAPWWLEDPTRNEFEELIGINDLDYITIMAYRDNANNVCSLAQGVVNVAKEKDMPFVIALETQEFLGGILENNEFKPDEKEFVTFFEEGQSEFHKTLEQLQDRYKDNGLFKGFAIHFYQTSFTPWHIIESTGLQSGVFELGDTVSASVTLRSSDNFGTRPIAIGLSVRDSEGNIYPDNYIDEGKDIDTSEIILMEGMEKETVELKWTVPHFAKKGYYDLTIAVWDIDYNSNKTDKRNSILLENHPGDITQIGMHELSKMNVKGLRKPFVELDRMDWVEDLFYVTPTSTFEIGMYIYPYDPVPSMDPDGKSQEPTYSLQKGEYTALIDQLKDNEIKRLFVSVYYPGVDPNGGIPKGIFLIEKKVCWKDKNYESPEPIYPPQNNYKAYFNLQTLIDEAKKEGIEVHATINAFGEGVLHAGLVDPATDSSHLTELKEVTDYLVTNYNGLTGIHLEHIRYHPKGNNAGENGYNKSTSAVKGIRDIIKKQS